MRLDIYLVTSGIAPSREKAKGYIKDGLVTVNGAVTRKPSDEVGEGDTVKYLGLGERYVSRGGLKLEAAINSFSLDVKGLVCLDIGASTGGFTDCLLQSGAMRVYAVDVGHGQLSRKLAEDKRVISIEGVNVKDLSPDIIPEKPDIVTADLSFISVLYALRAAFTLMKDSARGVFLIKPQFEAGREFLSKGGIVRDRAAHIEVLKRVSDNALEIGFYIEGLIPSPIKGGDGNIEYLILLSRKKPLKPCLPDYKKTVDSAFLGGNSLN